MKIDDAGRKALFDEGIKKDADYRTSKVRETEIARIQVKARVQASLDERNAFYAALVDDHGFSVTEIARIMSTSNRATAKGAIEAGRALRPAKVAPVASTRYRYDADEKILTATFTPEDLAPYKALIVEMPTELSTFGFTFDGSKLLPVEQDWAHPVVTVMMMPELQREAIAYIGRIPTETK